MIACPVTLTLILLALVRWLASLLAPTPGIESMSDDTADDIRGLFIDVLEPDLARHPVDRYHRHRAASDTVILDTLAVWQFHALDPHALDGPTPPPTETQILSPADAAWTRYLADCLDPEADAALLAPSGLPGVPDVKTLVGACHVSPADSERLDALWADLDLLREGRQTSRCRACGLTHAESTCPRCPTWCPECDAPKRSCGASCHRLAMLMPDPGCVCGGDPCVCGGAA